MIVVVRTRFLHEQWVIGLRLLREKIALGAATFVVFAAACSAGQQDHHDAASTDGDASNPGDAAPEGKVDAAMDRDVAKVPDASLDEGAPDLGDTDAAPSCRQTTVFDWPGAVNDGSWVASGAKISFDVNDAVFLPAGTVLTDALISASSYVLEFDLVLNPGLTLLIEPSGQFAGSVPSVTATGPDLVLGSAQVGDGGMATPPLLGQRFAQSLMVVRVFVEGAPARIGMEIDADLQTFWSGFANLPASPKGLAIVVVATDVSEVADGGGTGGTSLAAIEPIDECDRSFDDHCTTTASGFCGTDTAPR
jgi:hypothetical protein